MARWPAPGITTSVEFGIPWAINWASAGGVAASWSPTIPANRADSLAVAQKVLAWLTTHDPKSGPDPLPLSIDVAGWHRIDKAEIAAGALLGRPRVKLIEWKSLLDIAQGDGQA